VSNLHTSCRDCFYAIYEESEKTQIGCHFNKLEKIKENGITITESFDEEKEFFVLEKHACMAYRTKSSMIAANQDVQESMTLTRKQMSPKIAAVINVFSKDEEDLKKTIQQISDQDVQFYEVIFCVSSDIKPSEIISLMHKLNCTFKWNIKQIIDEYWLGSRAINVSVQNSKSTYFALFNSGFNIPKAFVKEIDEAICDQMKRFIVLHGVDEQGNGSVYQTYAFNALRGNEDAFIEQENDKPAHTFLEKLNYLAAQSDLMHLLKKCEEVCPCMKNQ